MTLDTPPITLDGSPSGGPVGGDASEVSLPDPTDSPMLEAALWYHAQGFNVIPQDRAKKPLVKWKLYQDRRVTEEEIREWWTRSPNANIAIVTGAISDLVVLDMDGDEGVQSMSELPGAGRVATTTVKTGNGYHAYFKHPGGKIKTVRIRPGLDIKGDGGLVTVPPSVHKSGAVYTFADGYSLDDLSPADIPAPLLAMLQDEGKKGDANGSNPPAGANGAAPALSRYVQEALDREIGRAIAADEGTRNDVLNKAAFNLGQFVGAGALPYGHAEHKLFQAVTRAGLPEDEARATIKSGLEAGMEQPREGLSSVLSVPDWGVLQELPPELPKVPRLSEELLPEPLRPWLADAAERTEIPLEFFAVSAVVALGALIGRRVGIRPKRKDDWLVVPNLWGAIIARPGVMKSAALSEALMPLDRLVKEARKKFEEATADAEARQAVLEINLGGLKQRATALVKKGDAESKAELESLNEEIIALKKEQDALQVTERRYITSDATTEKLGELLGQNPRGLLIFRDELAGWLRTLSKPGREGDREFYLESWNGTGSFAVDRIGRGSLYVEAMTLSVLGGIQPNKLRAYTSDAFKGGAGDDGLLQRIQVVAWPDGLNKWRDVDREPDEKARDRAFHVFREIDKIDPLGVGATKNFAPNGIPSMRFAPDAQEVFNGWRSKLERRLRSDEFKDCPAFESHLAKYRSLMPSLALIFHLAGVVDGGTPGPVSLAAAKMAVAWCEFLEAHARKVYAPELMPGASAAHALAKKIKLGAVVDGTPVRDLYRNGWSGLSSSDAVWSALKELERLGWLRVVTLSTRGAPSHVVALHPELRGGEA